MPETTSGSWPVLFRYMDRGYCEQMVDEGVVRLTKSSRYVDGTGMSEFQMDDEHVKSLEFEASGVDEVVDRTVGINIAPEVVRLAEKPEGGLYRISARVECPYWMFCFSTDLRLDLFGPSDFQCDAAVLVRDPPELFRRMASAADADGISSHTGRVLGQPVSYATSDELRYGMSPATISPFFTKPVKYSHQKEFRFVVYPCRDAEDFTFLRVGNLADISDVVGKEEVERGDVDEVVRDGKAFGETAQRALLNNGHTLLAKVRGRRVRDLVLGEDGRARVTGERTYGNSLARVVLDYLTEAPAGPRIPLEEIDLDSFHKAEQISKRPVYPPKDE